MIAETPSAWITRTSPGAALTASRVRALGWTAWTRPLLEVRKLDTPIPMIGVGALAFTSPNGVNAFADLCDKRDLSVFAVGDGTADAARTAGFEHVKSAAGDIHDLVDLIEQERRTFNGHILRPGAQEPAGDLEGALLARGVEAKSCAVYKTTETEIDPDGPEIRRLSSGETTEVLIHSPRAGRRLASLLQRPVQARFVCISAAAALPFIEAGHATVVAVRPSEEGLLAALGRPQARQVSG